MQYSQEHLKTMVYAEFGGQKECIMGNWKIENGVKRIASNIITFATAKPVVEQRGSDLLQRDGFFTFFSSC